MFLSIFTFPAICKNHIQPITDLLFANPGVGLAVLGAGLMVIAIGVIGTVVGVRLCIIVFPGIVRGIVYILRKPFHRKAVA